MQTDKMLVIPDYVVRSFDASDISLEELAEALVTVNVEKLNFIANKVSHSDIRDIVSLTSYVISKSDLLNRVSNVPQIFLLIDSIKGNIISPDIYMNSIETSPNDFNCIVNDERTTEEVISTLSDDKFKTIIVGDFIITVVNTEFLMYLKIKPSIALIELFSKFLNLQSKLHGPDVHKQSYYIYTFLRTLPNRFSKKNFNSTQEPLMTN